ncbi:N,N-dimethylformamidase beta subunit family domain-containing protein [Mesorhizobium sp. B2-5-7]|uniref:N,N-dimethylformamidase beta subunit family domain-containing protein n=1 Tax=Mesorhizobium sp. B2-5-7 TaxID=2589923 RepID=UPI0015E3E913|nr:N,N-dimethylformamidase beta subunit family domain-containing protein [Mesorhizobium sp. B2-5-7]
MKRPVDHGAMAVSGYTVPWHTAAGTPVALHVSSSRPVRDVHVVRLDTQAAEPMGWRVEPTGNAVSRRDFDHGSFLRVAAAELAKATEIEGVAFEVYLTRNDGARVLFESGNLRLGLQDGRLISGDDGNSPDSDVVLPANTWLKVEISSNDGATVLRIDSDDLLSPFRLDRRFDLPWRLLTGDMVFGTSTANDVRSLNAKFSTISLQTAAGRIAWTFPTLLPRGPLASTGTDRVLFLETVNQPAFCMTSRRWDGSSFDPRLVPSHYDAVHCHDDDMEALQWPASYQLQVPAEAPAGVYAFEVGHDEGSERIVFFITSSERRAPLLFLVPTATYLAYADEFLPAHLYEWMCEDRGHRFAIDNNLKSLYDYHSDLSGVSICSTRKPKATLRDDYKYPLCGCPHNLPVDLHFLRFCHNNDIAFDLITDRDLHELGLAGLQEYQAVITGSHPEYMSVEMEHALRQFAAAGGSIAYLGGNGFAGKVAFQDDLMELRRSPLEAGRTWDGPIAEQSLSITNQPGGYLRASGRGEFSLTGVAISLMGFDGARPFTRTPESRQPSAAWLFDGVTSETFGDEGIVLGGAAGYEVDATDPHLGTSPDTMVIARATGFPDSFVHDATRWYEGGDRERDERRCAEMTLRHLPSGGLIFCASSVAWCGALPAGDAMNDVGRITRNLLTHLAQEKRLRIDSRKGRQPAAPRRLRRLACRATIEASIMPGQSAAWVFPPCRA